MKEDGVTHETISLQQRLSFDGDSTGWKWCNNTLHGSTVGGTNARHGSEINARRRRGHVYTFLPGGSDVPDLRARQGQEVASGVREVDLGERESLIRI
jgi:hypothetical protein